MKKRILSLLLSIVMVIGILPITVMVIGILPITALAANEEAGVHVIVENTTFTPETAESLGATWKEEYWSGTLVDTWVPIDNNSTMMSCVVTALEQNGYTQKGAENNYIAEINGLSEFNGGSLSGWMGALNDWFVNEAFGAFTVANGKLEAGDEIRIMYTASFGEDLGGSWGNNDTTVKAIAFSEGQLAPTFEKNTHEYTLTVPAGTQEILVTPTASNKNFQVRTKVDNTVYKRTAKVPVSDGTDIVVECAWDGSLSMNGSGEPKTYTIHVVEEQVPLDPRQVMNDTLAQLAKDVPNPQFGTNGGEWTVLALARGGYFDSLSNEYFKGYYDRVVKTVNETAAKVNNGGALHSMKLTENSRLILALSAIGKESTQVGDWNIVEPLSNIKNVSKQGINGPVYALLALDTYDYLLQMQGKSLVVGISRNGSEVGSM